MAWLAAQQSIGVAASVVVTPSADASPQFPQKVYLWNRHATQDVFLGGSGVTTATGFQLKAGDTKEIVFDTQDPLFAIASGAATPLHVLKNRA